MCFCTLDIFICSGDDVPEIASDNLNKSDNWADTSFGREVMNVSILLLIHQN